ncbi:unnamed protein product, partial [Urochloa humidicola]
GGDTHTAGTEAEAADVPADAAIPQGRRRHPLRRRHADTHCLCWTRASRDLVLDPVTRLRARLFHPSSPAKPKLSAVKPLLGLLSCPRGRLLPWRRVRLSLRGVPRLQRRVPPHNVAL